MKIIDTTQLQTESLVNFMRKLGYVRNGVTGCGFKKKRYYLNGKWNSVVKSNSESAMYISFKDAQSLHNGITVRVCGDYWDMLGMKHLQLSQESYREALKCRLVERTYLQYHKKGSNKGRVIPQQHLVKITDVGKNSGSPLITELLENRV
mgnify:FL=1